MTSKLLETVLDAIPAPAAVIGRDGTLVANNAAAKALVDLERSELRRLVSQTARRDEWIVTEVDGGREYLVVGRRDDRKRFERAARGWKLTARQKQVLEQLVAGMSNHGIARTLGISERTVEVHVTAILQKAGVESRSALPFRVYGEP